MLKTIFVGILNIYTIAKPNQFTTEYSKQKKFKMLYENYKK